MDDHALALGIGELVFGFHRGAVGGLDDPLCVHAGVDLRGGVGAFEIEERRRPSPPRPRSDGDRPGGGPDRCGERPAGRPSVDPRCACRPFRFLSRADARARPHRPSSNVRAVRSHEPARVLGRHSRRAVSGYSAGGTRQVTPRTILARKAGIRPDSVPRSRPGGRWRSSPPARCRRDGGGDPLPPGDYTPKPAEHDLAIPPGDRDRVRADALRRAKVWRAAGHARSRPPTSPATRPGPTPSASTERHPLQVRAQVIGRPDAEVPVHPRRRRGAQGQVRAQQPRDLRRGGGHAPGVGARLRSGPDVRRRRGALLRLPGVPLSEGRDLRRAARTTLRARWISRWRSSSGGCPGYEIEGGWGWPELSAVDDAAGGATRAEAGRPSPAGGVPQQLGRASR